MHLQWPIKSIPGQEPPISQPYGGHLADYSRFGLLGHDGVDFPQPLDTPVYAAHDGFIVYANSDKRDMGLGIMQYFEEDGLGYLLEYWHFDSIQFPDIDHRADKFTFKEVPVKVGDLIGKVDTTGFSTGNHLHFGLYIFKNNQLLNYDNGYHGAVDPLPYLRNQGTIMQLIRDNGTIFLVSSDKLSKIGIGNPDILNIFFPTEPIIDGDTSTILQNGTMADQTYVVLHK